jgi:hypothetical protein
VNSVTNLVIDHIMSVCTKEAKYLVAIHIVNLFHDVKCKSILINDFSKSDVFFQNLRCIFKHELLL